MHRQPALPGTVPNARVAIDDAALDALIDISDRSLAGDRGLDRATAEVFLHAMPALLRELRAHRRTQALPAITYPLAVNTNAALPLRVS